MAALPLPSYSIVGGSKRASRSSPRDVFGHAFPTAAPLGAPDTSPRGGEDKKRVRGQARGVVPDLVAPGADSPGTDSGNFSSPSSVGSPTTSSSGYSEPAPSRAKNKRLSSSCLGKKKRPWNTSEDRRLLEVVAQHILKKFQMGDFKVPASTVWELSKYSLPGLPWMEISKEMNMGGVFDRNSKQCRERFTNFLVYNRGVVGLAIVPDPLPPGGVIMQVFETSPEELARIRKAERQQKASDTRRHWTAAEDAVLVDLQAKLGNKWAIISTHLPNKNDSQVKNRWYSKQRKQDRQAKVPKQASPQEAKAVKASPGPALAPRAHMATYPPHGASYGSEAGSLPSSRGHYPPHAVSAAGSYASHPTPMAPGFSHGVWASVHGQGTPHNSQHSTFSRGTGDPAPGVELGLAPTHSISHASVSAGGSSGDATARTLSQRGLPQVGHHVIPGHFGPPSAMGGAPPPSGLSARMAAHSWAGSPPAQGQATAVRLHGVDSARSLPPPAAPVGAPSARFSPALLPAVSGGGGDLATVGAGAALVDLQSSTLVGTTNTSLTVTTCPLSSSEGTITARLAPLQVGSARSSCSTASSGSEMGAAAHTTCSAELKPGRPGAEAAGRHRSRSPASYAAHQMAVDFTICHRMSTIVSEGETASRLPSLATSGGAGFATGAHTHIMADSSGSSSRYTSGGSPNGIAEEVEAVRKSAVEMTLSVPGATRRVKLPKVQRKGMTRTTTKTAASLLL